MKLSDVRWTPAVKPLSANGLLIRAAAYPSFKTKLAGFSKEQKSRLKLAHHNDTCILLGKNDDLPWIPGAVYLGKEMGVPSLYLPTTLTPSFPPSLIANAVNAIFGSGQYVIDPKNQYCFNISAALPLSQIDPETLP